MACVDALGETLGDTFVAINPPPATETGVPMACVDALGESTLVVIVAVPSADCHAGVPTTGVGTAPEVAPRVMVPGPSAVEIWMGPCARAVGAGSPRPAKRPIRTTNPRPIFEVNRCHLLFIFPPGFAPPRGQAHRTMFTYVYTKAI